MAADCDFEVRHPPAKVYRLAREPDPWDWPDWAFAGPDNTFGNRWDDPEGSYRVLYASGKRLGAFVETLARIRRDPKLEAGLAAVAGPEFRRLCSRRDGRESDSLWAR